MDGQFGVRDASDVKEATQQLVDLGLIDPRRVPSRWLRLNDPAR